MANQLEMKCVCSLYSETSCSAFVFLCLPIVYVPLTRSSPEMAIPSNVGHIQSLMDNWAETGTIQGCLIVASRLFMNTLRRVHAEATWSPVILGIMRGAHAAFATSYKACAFNVLAYFCVTMTRMLPSVPLPDMKRLNIYILVLFEFCTVTVVNFCNDRCPGFC